MTWHGARSRVQPTCNSPATSPAAGGVAHELQLAAQAVEGRRQAERHLVRRAVQLVRHLLRTSANMRGRGEVEKGAGKQQQMYTVWPVGGVSGACVRML